MAQVTLQSKDNQDFKVEIEVAETMETVKNLMEDAGTDSPIPLNNVEGRILSKVLAYSKYHSQTHTEDEIFNWDTDFCEVDQPTLFDLILAANYLDISNLLDLTCKQVANMIKGKTPDEIRRTFNIKNDFTKEEEEQVRKENEWCEEK